MFIDIDICKPGREKKQMIRRNERRTNLKERKNGEAETEGSTFFDFLILYSTDVLPVFLDSDFFFFLGTSRIPNLYF